MIKRLFAVFWILLLSALLCLAVAGATAETISVSADPILFPLTIDESNSLSILICFALSLLCMAFGLIRMLGKKK